MTLADLANLAAIAMALAAFVALAFGVWQTRQYRRQQLESVARDRYQAFLELCVQYPEFAQPLDGAVDPVAATFDGDQKKFIQYGWFIWSCLNALEVLYFVLGHQKSWRNTINSILRCHVVYLSSSHILEGVDTFEPEFYALIKEWLPTSDKLHVTTIISSMAAE